MLLRHCLLLILYGVPLGLKVIFIRRRYLLLHLLWFQVYLSVLLFTKYGLLFIVRTGVIGELFGNGHANRR